MKNLFNGKPVESWFLIAVSIAILQSCAAYNSGRYRPVTVADIVQMSKDKVPPDKIINTIRKSQTVYRLQADQLTKLSKEGVSDPVINYMEKTHLDAIRNNQRLDNLYYWWPGEDGYDYGGPAFGWPENYDHLDWGLGDLGEDEGEEEEGEGDN